MFIVLILSDGVDSVLILSDGVDSVLILSDGVDNVLILSDGVWRSVPLVMFQKRKFCVIFLGANFSGLVESAAFASGWTGVTCLSENNTNAAASTARRYH